MVVPNPVLNSFSTNTWTIQQNGEDAVLQCTFFGGTQRIPLWALAELHDALNAVWGTTMVVPR